MSSACFKVRVVQVKKNRCETEWLSLPAGGAKAVVTSRAAALLMLWEADTQRKNPLRVALENEPTGWLTRPSWYEKNVERFVLSAEIGERINAEANLSDVWRKVEAARDPAKGLALAWAQGHRFALTIEVTDPKWLAHLRAGDELETTAFDVSGAAPVARSPTAKVVPVAWSRRSRAKVHGSKTAHPLDPAVPSPAKDWMAVTAALQHMEVAGKGAKTAQRALAPQALPTALDPDVERFRYLLVPQKAVAPLLRTWWRTAGPSFVWTVLAGTSAPIDVIETRKDGSRSIEEGVRFAVDEHLGLAPSRRWKDPQDEGLFATLRRLSFTLPEREWASFRKAASALLSKHRDSSHLVYALGRDSALAPKYRGRAGEGEATIVASLHDPAAALAYVQANPPRLLGAYAFDVVELLGAAARDVIQPYVDADTDGFDETAREALAVAHGLAP